MSNGTGIAGSRTATRGTVGGGLRLDGCSSGVGMRIGGHASLFGIVDLGRDAVEPGAFAAALARRGAAGIRMLFQHDPAEPVGRWTAIREDAAGLWVEGRLTAGVQKADELAALISSGALDGLSIGFRTVRAANDRRNGVRRILEADLWEVSIVTFPMLPGARLAVLPEPAASPERIVPDRTMSDRIISDRTVPERIMSGWTARGRTPPRASPAPRGDGGRFAALRLAAGMRSAAKTLHGKEGRA